MNTPLGDNEGCQTDRLDAAKEDVRETSKWRKISGAPATESAPPRGVRNGSEPLQYQCTLHSWLLHTRTRSGQQWNPNENEELIEELRHVQQDSFNTLRPHREEINEII